jgi:hypothetical protein
VLVKQRFVAVCLQRLAPTALGAMIAPGQFQQQFTSPVHSSVISHTQTESPATAVRSLYLPAGLPLFLLLLRWPGSMGGTIEACCLQPIDVIKTRLQLDKVGKYKGAPSSSSSSPTRRASTVETLTTKAGYGAAATAASIVGTYIDFVVDSN